MVKTCSISSILHAAVFIVVSTVAVHTDAVMIT